MPFTNIPRSKNNNIKNKYIVKKQLLPLLSFTLIGNFGIIIYRYKRGGIGWN